MKAFWLLLGCAALLLGAIGILLPLLPTTPFVILAAFAFSKSSPTLQRRLESNKIFGPIITDWRNHGAIAPFYKILAIGMMAMALLLSILLSLSIPVLIIQAICLSAAAAYILSRPSA
jgi:hypothetical protein